MAIEYLFGDEGFRFLQPNTIVFTVDLISLSLLTLTISHTVTFLNISPPSDVAIEYADRFISSAKTSTSFQSVDKSVAAELELYCLLYRFITSKNTSCQETQNQFA